MNKSRGPPTEGTVKRAARRSLCLSAATAARSSHQPPLKVAIIGAGAAGLVTARVLLRNGIQPIILEKDTDIGGVWNYQRDNSSTRPMYRGLRTNLPREIMAYREFPWGGDGVTRSFVTHGQVKDYLKRYTKEFDIENWIRFGCVVRHLQVLTDKASCVNSQWPKIRLEWEDFGKSGNNEEGICCRDDFDAVCVCNGHYTTPFVPEIPGLEQFFQGKIYHSIEYDDPSIFKDQIVLCIGGRASGSDLAREISMYAKKVYLSDTLCPDLSEQNGQPIEEGNVAWVPTTMAVNADSTIAFRKDCRDSPNVDCIMFCSGYDYHFPFINEESNVDLSALAGERRVMPLYEQLWHAKYPSLTFVGLQHSIVPFPFFELQAEALVSQLQNGDSTSDNWTLPPLDVRIQAAEVDAKGGGPNEVKRVQDTHFLGNFQWDACLKYSKFAGVYNKKLQKYIGTNKAIYDHASKTRKGLFPAGIDSYRSNSYVRDDEHESFQVNFIQEEIAIDV